MDQSLQLARLWTTLAHLEDQLVNVAIPLGGHLGLDDPALMSAMEELADRINAHFERFRLVAEVRRS